jgi:glycosyltransferase involved in cell wall biosynthesis
MKNKQTILFTVTTDLSYDQRMQRICTSLANAGYKVLLVGRVKKNSIPLSPQPYLQKRLHCLFEKGKLFYAAYNIRLFFYLLFKKTDSICAIDLDSILPCYFVSVLKNKIRIYDAHELFCEMKEIAARPGIYTIWKAIERYAVPKFLKGYTVNQPIADEFKAMYGVNYEVVRNIALLRENKEATCNVEYENTIPQGKFILYQGAVNEGRCFETLIPAMKQVACPLIICGDGNFMEQAKALVKLNQLENKVIFKGNIPPDELREITRMAYAGITLFDDAGKSNYYSLANRFFDYLQAGIPQLCVAYPVYEEINNQYPIALLVNDTGSNNLAMQLNNLLNNGFLYNSLKDGCSKARLVFNWQEEEKKLLNFYEKLW